VSGAEGALFAAREAAQQRRSDLWAAGLAAAAAHAALLVWVPAALLAPAVAGQKPGVTSLEISLSASAEPRRAARLEAAPVPPVEREPAMLPRVDVPEPLREWQSPTAEPARVAVAKVPEFPSSAGAAPSAASSGAKAAAVAGHSIEYPRWARLERREGVAVARVEVRSDGRAGKVQLVRSSGHADLDAAALEGLRLARYQPATDGRRPVAGVLEQPVRFTLTEDGRAVVR